MATKCKRTRKLRGHVSAGHGRVGKHRKHPGGRGKCGGMTHHRINFDKYHPGYFGKVGMRHFHLLKNQKFCPTVNVEKLWSLLAQGDKDAGLKTSTTSSGTPTVNCTKLGFFKVLGKGNVPPQPITVQARFFSKQARQKIEAAGGCCIVDGLNEAQ